MPKVSNLTIKKQSGSNTHFATWEFDTGSKNNASSSTSVVKAGDLVSIKAGSTYYNGVAIPDWVMAERWYVLEVRGDRAVIDQNESGTNWIMSPISVNCLVGGSGSSSGSSPSVDPSTLDHYEVAWYYDTLDGVWFEGSSSDVESNQSTYSAPDNAWRIKVVVTPVSKTYKVNDEDVSYWTGTSTSVIYSLSIDPPDAPSTPTVEIDGYKLTASIDNISDPLAAQIKFEIYNGTTLFNSGIATVRACQAAYSCSVNAGGSYRVRCAAINLIGSTQVMSDWSDFASAVGTIPSTPAGITSIKATSETSVRLEWSAVESAETYEIEYTTKVEYFDGSDSTTSVTGIEGTQYEKTGLDSGEEYFFRVRATNDQGSSGWSGVKSVVVGKTPTAPTTWSSSSTVIVGEDLNLYWVHNSRDNSSETYAQVEITIGSDKETLTIENTDTGDDEDRTKQYTIHTDDYVEGTTILWRVRTAGVTEEYGDWSVLRTVDVYAPPTLSLSLTNQNGSAISTVTGFPIYLQGLAGPSTQVPVSYHVVVTSQEMYETLDGVGNKKVVNKGEDVYDTHVDTSDPLNLELLPSVIDLENSVTYTATVTVAMDSGLTCEQSVEFTVSWADDVYEPDAEIGIDKTNFSAYIRPYCLDNEGDTVENITLAVFRRDYDGGYTEIASGLDPLKNVFVTDPHPSLDYARYRIVATSNSTGAVSYYDCPPIPIHHDSVILQWDEDWQEFGEGRGDVMEHPPWSGSMLQIRGNIDVSDSTSPDVSLVEYIGRSHPVSYYGTQRGVTSSWSMAVPKSDTDTLYALRRLAMWMGDVYVREPSGSGYWANIKVSFSQKHCDLTLPISLSVTRVEGGV